MALGIGKTIVGLELDSGVARAVELTGSVKAHKVTVVARGVLPEGAVEEGMVQQPEIVGEALREMWSSSALTGRSVLLGVSNQGVLVRHAVIPKVSPDKLKNVIRFHAPEYLPIPLDTVILDYLVVGETVTDAGAALEVLFVAARRDMLAPFLEALAIARLEPLDIDVSTLALVRILPQAVLERTLAVVNVANGLTNILISAKGQPRLARLVSVKIKELSDRLGSLPDEVPGDSAGATEAQQNVLSAWFDNLSGEIRSSINYYQNQEGSSEVEGIILNGRGAQLRGIAARLEDTLEMVVRTVDPFTIFSEADQKITGSGLQTVEYAISAGLARRGLEGL
ncbi:MAG TPA: type IV pilus assembly protein PilM [Candidatus Limnocylindrales bacterium]|nr:type IV pilus assembly protein PilM [Candidatus Limnocylindrales bacterium]